MSVLSKMPPEILTRVLNSRAMPICDRLRLRLISNRWADIIENGLKKVKALVVNAIDADEYPFPNQNDLKLSERSMSEDLLQILIDLFPGTTELTFAFGNRIVGSVFDARIRSQDMVVSLLNKFASNLEKVSLYGRIYPSEAELVARSLVSLPKITSLFIKGIESTNSLINYLVPVLPRLVQFSCPGLYDHLYDNISLHLSPKCTHLFIDTKVFMRFDVHFLYQLATNLTHLNLLGCVEPDWSVLLKFRKLTFLSLELQGLVSLF